MSEYQSLDKARAEELSVRLGGALTEAGKVIVVAGLVLFLHRAARGIAGFPPHPHRGFNTFTYMIEGDMEHKDSMGNTGNLGPGGAQWMKAASGVIHSEMPK